MIYEPKQKNKAPEICILAFFVCATVLLGFSAVEGIGGKGVLQVGGLILFCPMVYILVRYKFTFFTYTVKKSSAQSLHREEDEAVHETGDMYSGLSVKSLPPHALELWIERRQGRSRPYCECVVQLSKIDGCIRLSNDKKERKEQMKDLGRAPTYKYLQNMVGSGKLLICADILGKRSFIIIEAEGDFADYLCAVARYNKEKRS